VARGSEHRMVFDLRGRRKRLVQVIYAFLAVLMGGGLIFFGIGTGANSGGVADLLNNGGSSSGNAGEIFINQAQKLEHELAKQPHDETLLVQLTRARYNAGNSQLQYDPNTGALVEVPNDAVEQLRKSGDAWSRYLKLNPQKPNPNVAQLAAKAMLFTASHATTAPDFTKNIKGAEQAEAIFAAARPSLNSYLTLAQYSFFAGDFAGAETAARKAQQMAPKAQLAPLKQAVGQYRKQGKQIQRQIKAATKFNPSAGGKEALQNPLGGLSGGGASLGTQSP
jgi:hypothetical protein